MNSGRTLNHVGFLITMVLELVLQNPSDLAKPHTNIRGYRVATFVYNEIKVEAELPVVDS